ncbi:hypothetical protein OH77DRAFT_1016457 [Trametes cingulata]|nr:hypothetical protein OH77DRAFT_1016457 [Trametes cingulata]
MHAALEKVKTCNSDAARRSGSTMTLSMIRLGSWLALHTTSYAEPANLPRRYIHPDRVTRELPRLPAGRDPIVRWAMSNCGCSPPQRQAESHLSRPPPTDTRKISQLHMPRASGRSSSTVHQPPENVAQGTCAEEPHKGAVKRPASGTPGAQLPAPTGGRTSGHIVAIETLRLADVAHTRSSGELRAESYHMDAHRHPPEARAMERPWS